MPQEIKYINLDTDDIDFLLILLEKLHYNAFVNKTYNSMHHPSEITIQFKTTQNDPTALKKLTPLNTKDVEFIQMLIQKLDYHYYIEDKPALKQKLFIHIDKKIDHIEEWDL